MCRPIALFTMTFDSGFRRFTISLPAGVRLASAVIKSFLGLVSRFMAMSISVSSRTLEYANVHLPSRGKPKSMPFPDISLKYYLP